jgi:hypothetical protein
MHYEKIWYQWPIPEFFIVTRRFSLVKAAINAPRICKLRNGVNKTPQFLPFQLPRQDKDHSTLFMIVNSGMKKNF